jgi:hypothetical protein
LAWTAVGSLVGGWLWDGIAIQAGVWYYDEANIAGGLWAEEVGLNHVQTIRQNAN